MKEENVLKDPKKPL